MEYCGLLPLTLVFDCSWPRRWPVLGLPDPLPDAPAVYHAPSLSQLDLLAEDSVVVTKRYRKGVSVSKRQCRHPADPSAGYGLSVGPGGYAPA